MHVQQGIREKEKWRQVLTQQILYLTWKVVIAVKLYLRNFKQPPLLER